VGPQTWAGHQDGLLDEIEQLLKELGDDEDELDRLLATGPFTDIVRPRSGRRSLRRCTQSPTIASPPGRD
jgi:hypothetical protein